MFRVLQVVAVLLLLFVALGKQPYDYYTLLRFFLCGVCGYGAFKCHSGNLRVGAWVYGVIAVLYNPFVKIHLSRTTWEPINLLTALTIIGLMVWCKKVEAKGRESAG